METQMKSEKFHAKKNYRKANTTFNRHAPPAAKALPVEVPIEKNCDRCNETFTTTWKWDTLCRSCTTLQQFRDHIGNVLLNDDKQSCTFPDPDGKLVYPNFKIRIEYSVKTNTHCGYCSDHCAEDVRHNTFTKTIVCPLFRKFKSKDFNPATNDVTNVALLRNMYNPKDSYNCNCGDGEQSFSIRSATIFKNADIITLDD